MTVTLPWDATQTAYVAALLREEAQRKVDSAACLQGDSLVKGLRANLAGQAIMIDGMATDLSEAEVTNEREDDLGEEDCGRPAGHGSDDGLGSTGMDA